ncbi:MAG: RagB/SusD family nutrient uptake outer membrane protein [Nitritalea sp.]
MKKNIFSIALAATMLAFGSCSDVLDVDPRQSLTVDQALADVNGFNGISLTMYGRLRNFGYYGQTMMIAPEVLADNVLMIANTGRYIGEEVNQDRAHMQIWNTAIWSAINDANIILDGVDNVPGAEATKNRLKGEAHFVRALTHFDFARIYGYEPNREVNNWNLSTILRTNATLSFSDADLRTRNTITQVYEQVEADLLAAIDLLPPVAMGASPGVYRATRGAAQALLARVYLYWGRNDRAAALATQAMATVGLAENGTGLIEPDNYRNAFNTFPNPESIFEVEIRQVDWSTVDGVNNSMSSLTSNAFPNAQFIASASRELIASMEEGDARMAAWEQTTRAGFAGPVFASNKWRGAKGEFLENLPILRGSELFLIRAEARQKLGDNAGARADLNALRAKRSLPAVDAGLTGNALFEAILQEKRVEFAMEGHRFFDLKRNGLAIRKHRGLPPVPFNDYRILSFLPQSQIQLNPDLEQNPGY